jgi:hypothetical protein
MCRDFVYRGEKMAYIVYKHTSPSGKVYIGITSLRPEERWGGGAGYVKNKHFNRAIKKYGWENIKHEILFDGLSKEDACKIEIELIKEYKFRRANNTLPKAAEIQTKSSLDLVKELFGEGNFEVKEN